MRLEPSTENATEYRVGMPHKRGNVSSRSATVPFCRDES